MATEIDLSDLDLSDKITVVEQLHWGNFSDVWRGTMNKDAKEIEVAIKALRVRQANRSANGRSTEDRLRKRFTREVLIWRKLQHQNVVPLLGYAMNENGLPTLVSPWYANGSLIDYLKSHPEASRLSLVMDVTSGLEYLHSIPLAHGDIKGENVLVNSVGSASLCDFGLSHFIDEALHITGFTTTNANAGGTDRYLCPELLEDEPKSTMTDMWAFGCLVALIFTGDIPYNTVTKRHLVPNAILSGKPPYTNLEDFIDKAIWHMLKKCWSQTPTDRPKISELSSLILPPIRMLRRSVVLEFEGHFVIDAQFSSDGRILAVATNLARYEVEVQFWNYEDKSWLSDKFTFPAYTKPSMAWSPTAQHLMIYAGRSFWVWKLEADRELSLLKKKCQAETWCWLSTGQEIAFVQDSYLYGLNLAGRTTRKHALPFMSRNTAKRPVPLRHRCLIAASADGYWILLYVDTGSTFEIFAHNIRTGKLEGPTSTLYFSYSAVFSTDAQFLVVNDDVSVRTYEIRTIEGKAPAIELLQNYYWENRRLILVHGPEFGGHQDRYIVCRSQSGKIYIWERDTAKYLGFIRPWDNMNVNGAKNMHLTWRRSATSPSVFAVWKDDSDSLEIWSFSHQSGNESQIESQSHRFDVAPKRQDGQ